MFARTKIPYKSPCVRRLFRLVSRNVSSTECKQSLEVTNGSVTPTQASGQLVKANISSSSLTGGAPKILPIWNSRSDHVNFLQIDCTDLDRTMWDLFETRVKNDVVNMTPDSVYMQNIEKDFYSTRLTVLMSQLGYHSYFHQSHAGYGQATFYKTKIQE